MSYQPQNNDRHAVPTIRKCGTMSVHLRQLENYPNFRKNLIDLEQGVKKRMASQESARTRSVDIPVVVHVVFNNDTQNISDAQVNSQIKVLNEDYSATNTDRSKTPSVWAGLVTSTNIKFELAKKDPTGNSTSGITRTQTNKSSFGDDDSVKFTGQGGIDAWPTDKYLNIWVCNLGNQLLGYAQFPGGPTDTDGVVILCTAFGTEGTATSPFDKGRTTTHEVGHWLNLRHIWGDDPQCQGSDFVNDTPNQQTPNFGKPEFPHLSCSNGPNGDMFMNYMDYVDDDSMFMFTSEQVGRMQATLNGPRNSLGT